MLATINSDSLRSVGVLYTYKKYMVAAWGSTTNYLPIHHRSTGEIIALYNCTASKACVLSRMLDYSRCGHAFASTADTTTVTTMNVVSNGEAARLPADCEVSSSSVQKSPADVPVQVHPKSVHTPAPPQTIPSNWQNTVMRRAARRAG